MTGLVSPFFFWITISAFPPNIASLDSIRKSFSTHKGFEVKFTQTIKQSVFPNQKDLASGKVVFERPHHLVWTYEKPSKRVLEYNGKRLTIQEDHEPKEEMRADESSQDFSMNLEQTFSFLWGETNQTAYSLTNGDKPSTFVILPKKKNEGAFRRIEVTVKSGFVESARVINTLEGESDLHFQNWKLK